MARRSIELFPIWTPKYVIFFNFLAGALLMGIGWLTFASNESVIECKREYRDPEGASTETLTLRIEPKHCQKHFVPYGSAPTNPPTKLKGPVYIYYRLTSFYQSHRRYVNNRSHAQLKGHRITNPHELKSCDPFTRAAEVPNEPILVPCGIVARSIFNDTYYFVDKNMERITVDTRAETISWPTDVKIRYKNPEHPMSDNVYLWMDQRLFPDSIESGHFMNWMQVSGVPEFQKLWGKIEEDVELPISIEVINHYRVSQWSGTKSLVLSTSTWMGGKHMLLPWVYFFWGTIFLIGALLWAIRHALFPYAMAEAKAPEWDR